MNPIAIQAVFLGERTGISDGSQEVTYPVERFGIRRLEKTPSLILGEDSQW